jgi:hypothetical protein
LCLNVDSKGKSSTEYNPQSNSVIERVHQTLGNMLWTFELEKQELNEVNPWAPFLNAATWAICSTYHVILEAMPGQLVFGRDNILTIQFKANWASILQHKQDQISKYNARKNSQWILLWGRKPL